VDFASVRITLASPEKIKSWSYGEVEKPETINYRTLKPERDGLFDERIFGPVRDWECACGKYKRSRYEGKVCERCGVEVTRAAVRRHRMGHIELATPCAHIWFVKDIPSRIGALLDWSTNQLEQVLYFAKYAVIDPQDAAREGRPLKRGDLLSDDEYRELRYGKSETYSVPMGAAVHVEDGEYVAQGQEIAKGVRARLDGLVTYRFPRSVVLEYAEVRAGLLILPAKSWIESDGYKPGEPIAELPEKLVVKAPHAGTVSIVDVGEGKLVTVTPSDDGEDATTFYLPPQASLLVEPGAKVRTDGRVAEFPAGTLTIPTGAKASVEGKKRGGEHHLRVELSWKRFVEHQTDPTMHVLVGDGATVRHGDRVVGAIDATREIVADADGVVRLRNPASMVVSRARVYPYRDEPVVVQGDRVRKSDTLADSGKVKSEISGRIEIDLVRRQVRVIECFDFEALMGAEAIRMLLEDIDLKRLEKELEGALAANKSRHNKRRISKRLEIVRQLIKSGNRPEWMVLESVPVMPPDLRPMVQVDGGRFATSDLNDLYRRLINRNNRLKKLIGQGAPEMIVRNEKRMLQEAVDALIDNGRRGAEVVHPGSDRPLRSLTDLLGGKQGRFRQNLLGKRVDYSGRSVIVVGPQLKLHQCGVPKRMALELFKPFLFKVLEERGIVPNIKSARKILERFKSTRDEIWDALEEVIEGRVVLLNRAPTLHRLGIQAFEPVLVEGRAIQVHPLVCEAFNADFDGDQMAIHVPLSVYAQSEARINMLSSHNLLSPQSGDPSARPSRDIVLGLYYLTSVREGRKGAGSEFKTPDDAFKAYKAGKLDLNSRVKVAGEETSIGRMKYRFANPDEAVMAVQSGVVDLQDIVRVRIGKEVISTTTGRVIFNRRIAEQIGDDGTPVPAEMVSYDTTYERNALRDLVVQSYGLLGIEKTARLLDVLKDMGFEYSTTSGITIGVDDVAIPETKAGILAESEKALERIEEYHRMGFLTVAERFEQVVRMWNATTDRVTSEVFKNFRERMPFNSLYVMQQSGSRGNPQQVRQLAGMRGLMAKPSGETIEVPIRANFREGLTVLEYFISTHGARKGGADTALRTADSGYLTRKLVDAAHEVVIREDDCQTSEFVTVPVANRAPGQVETSLFGRVLANSLKLRRESVPAGTHIDQVLLQRILKEEPASVDVRSPLSCRAKVGICKLCYGFDLATAAPVSIGEAVGVIAAQSIGEPGTQLTMRTFHTGGVAGGADITLGLPRVIELFEARKPKNRALIAGVDGKVRIDDQDDGTVLVTIGEGEFQEEHKIPANVRLIVRDKDRIRAGDPITRGSINPHDLLASRGRDAVERYLVDEVQRVYTSQGVKIHDKHIEIIVRQMLKYIEVDEPGAAPFLEGALVERDEIDRVNAELLDKDEQPAAFHPILLGITKSSLSTRSFLSAASFQHTTHVLTEAALAGKIDHLVGLKENVILGRLIPAGTGLLQLRQTQVVPGKDVEELRSDTPRPVLTADQVVAREHREEREISA
jgi:DNA-directed RNA polymerase subunit beta'